MPVGQLQLRPQVWLCTAPPVPCASLSRAGSLRLPELSIVQANRQTFSGNNQLVSSLDFAGHRICLACSLIFFFQPFKKEKNYS